MAKIIVKFPDDIQPEIALLAVQGVVESGRVSEARGRKKYCHATKFSSSQGPLWVYAHDLAYDNAPDSFVIIREAKNATNPG